MTSLAGAVTWAVVPFAPAAPFRLYAGAAQEPVVLPNASKIIEGIRSGGDAELTYMVPAKVRPVLVLSAGVDERFDEVFALRLLRLSKLTAEEQEQVRSGKLPTLFPLDPVRFDGLREQSAAMIAAPVRLHRSALEGRVLGTLDDADLREVHERFVRVHGLNIRGLIEERLRQLAATQKPNR